MKMWSKLPASIRVFPVCVSKFFKVTFDPGRYKISSDVWLGGFWANQRNPQNKPAPLPPPPTTTTKTTTNETKTQLVYIESFENPSPVYAVEKLSFLNYRLSELNSIEQTL